MEHLVTALVSHFHPLLTFAEVTQRPKDFEIECKESLLEHKMYVTAKEIVPTHLRRNIAGRI